MNFGLLGQITPQEMRRVRVKEIVEKANEELSKGLLNLQTMQPSREQEDNGKFISKYFDTVNNKQYQQLFCQYNQIMFAKLIYQMKAIQLSKGDFLYKKGDQATNFYFILKGKLEIVVDSSESGDFKFSKNADEFEFFGLRQSVTDYRHDYARAVTDSCWILSIDKDQYEQIVKKTQLSTSEHKIDFLVRYVPKLRNVSRSMIEEFEVFFIKEVVTQGYQIQKQDEQDDYIYFIFKGRCRLLISTLTQEHSRQIFPQEIQNDKFRKQLVVGLLKRGECFGEHSALNDLPNPCTVEALTKEVELYKILRSNFIQYFGGLQGEPVTQLRAQIVLKTNWLRSKLNYLKSFTLTQLQQLEYRNEEEFSKLRPSKQNPQEVSYIKNNPREKEVQISNGGSDSAQSTDVPKTARQREIENLKRSLLAPIPSSKPGGAGAQQQPIVASAVGMNRLDRGNGEKDDKFNKVMDWGTPRLVTKNRALVMDQKQMQQRAFLQNVAAVRKGQADNTEEEKKDGFKAASINNFRERMLQEEKEQNTEMKEPPVMKEPLPEKKVEAGSSVGGQFFNKLRNTTDEEAKSRLRTNFRQMPI